MASIKTIRGKILIISIVIFHFLFLSMQTTKGQDPTVPSTSFKVSFPSATPSTLGKYGEIPVSLYTGIPNISIPIYTVKSRSLSLNIKLNYHAGGNKPEEIPGWVGMGWSLDAGGMITRTVMGRPDGIGGWFADPARLDGNNWLYPSNELKYNIAVNPVGWDAQPDKYHFNFAGRSGGFVFAPDGSVRLNNYEKIKIERNTEDSGFVITTEDGTKYTFDTVERTYPDQGVPFISTWWLTKIESVNGDDFINFSYSPQFQIIQPKSFYIEDVIYQQCTGQSFAITDNNPDIINAVRLESITTSIPLQTVNFYSSNRSDQLDKKLDKITIRRDERSIEHFEFSYSDGNRLMLNSIQEVASDNITKLPPFKFAYNATSMPVGYLGNIDHWGFYNNSGEGMPDVSYYKGNGSVFVKNSGGVNRSPKAAYLFAGMLQSITYPTGGETKFEYGQHDYSSFNGSNPDVKEWKVVCAEPCSTGVTKTGSFVLNSTAPAEISYKFLGTNNSSSSEIKIYKGSSIVYSWSDDETNHGFHIISPILQQGTYSYRISCAAPTAYAELKCSVYTAISQDECKNLKASGVRIQRIIHQDQMGGQKILKYNYSFYDDPTKSAGILIDYPKYVNYYNQSICNLPQVPSVCELVTRCSSPKSGLGMSQGSPVVYKEVTTLYGESGEYGKTRSVFRFVPDVIGSSLIFNRSSKEWERGQLLDQYDYNGSEVIHSEKHYTYKDSLTSSTRALSVTSIPTMIGCSMVSTVDKYIYIIGPYEVYSGLIQCTTEQVIQYDENGQNPVITTKKYSYNPNHLQLTRIEETNSDGKKRITNMSYPLDYSVTNPSTSDVMIRALNSMKNVKNMVNPVIEKWIIQDEAGTQKVVSADLMLYKEYGPDQILPHKQLKLSSESPLPAGEFTVSNTLDGYHFGYNNSYALKNTFDAYDQYGNLLQGTDANEVTTAFKWGYNSSVPIAKIANATASQTFVDEFGGTTTYNSWTTYDNGNDGDTHWVITSDGMLKQTNDYNAANQENDRIVYDNGTEITGDVVFEFDLRIADSDSWDLTIGMGGDQWNTNGNGTESFVWTSIKNEDWIYYDNTYNWRTIKSGLVIGRTYHLKIIAKCTTGKVDFYVDGIRCIKDAAYKYNSTGIQKIAFGNYGWGTITSTWYIDNVRLYPETALAKSQSYLPTFLTVNQISDENGIRTNYEYDNFGRLSLIKDGQGNLLKDYTYYFSRTGNGDVFNATDPNFTQERIYRTSNDLTTTKTYIDGLGRDIQKQMFLNSDDIISHITYDPMGRTQRTYKPYQVSLGSNAHKYDPNYHVNARTYYQNLGVAAGEYPYSETSYLPDPTNRILKQASPGNDFRMGSGKEIKFNYSTDAVYQWLKNIRRDENDQQTDEYVDLFGKTVKSVVDPIGLNLATSFEYDVLGNVLKSTPPKGSSYSSSYQYNTLQKLTQKTSPDAGTVKYLYDYNGNLRLIKDANHSSSSTNSVNSGIRRITSLDTYPFTLNLGGKVTITAVKESGTSITVSIKTTGGTVLYSITGSSTTTVTGTIILPRGSYICEGKPSSSGAYKYSVNCTTGYELVYNKYDAFNRIREQGEYGSNVTNSFNLANALTVPNGTSFPPNGQLKNKEFLFDKETDDASITGQRNLKGKLSSASSYRFESLVGTSYYSYDENGRLEWIKQKGLGSALKTITYLYDQLGNITSKSTQEADGVLHQINYTYDKAGRVGAVSSASSPAASYQYLAPGTVSQLNLGNGLEIINYKYNSRDWLTNINESTTPRFSMTLGYNEPLHAYLTPTAKHNGNISWMKYSMKDVTFTNPINPTTQVGYTFDYDKANRLLSSNFAFDATSQTGGWMSTNALSEKNIEYDDNGNIKKLKRYGEIDSKSDHLEYNYNGNNNRLSSVTVTSSVPSLGINPASLSFGNVAINTTSSEKTYTITGTNLAPASGNITITSPLTNFQISLTSGSGYGSTLNIPYTGGALSQRTIYVKFSPAVVQSYSTSLTISGGGVSPSQSVGLTGTGVASVTPTININKTTLTFGNIVVNTTSASQTYQVSGTNLSPAIGIVSINAPAGYMISTSINGTYLSSLDISYSSGTLTAITIYVSFTPLSINSFNGSISNAGGGAPIKYVAVTGTGVSCSAPAAPTLTSPAYGATGVAVLTPFSWTTSSGATSYALEVSTDYNFGTTVVSLTGLTGGAYTLTTALANNTQYYWRMNATNPSCGTSAWTIPWNFKTIAVAPSLTVISPTSLSLGFGNVTVNTNSAQQSVTFAGSNLSPANETITVTAPTGYAVAKTSSGPFSSSINYSYTQSYINVTSFSVRFTPASAQSYSGNITISGGGAATSVAVSGTGIINTYLITVDAGTGGTITPGSTYVSQGANQTFSISANPGYRILNVVEDGGHSLGPVTSHTFYNVNIQHLLVAYFMRTYTVTTSSGFGFVTVSPSSTVVDQGGSVTLTFNYPSGVITIYFTINGVQHYISVPYGSTSGTYTIPNIQSNQTVYVNDLI